MFRLTMDTALFAGFAIAYLVLLGWALRLASGNGWWTLANVPLLVTAALVYDNGIIAAGRFIGAGDLLLGLNMARFWIHAIVTPLLVMWAWHSVRRSGATWAAHPLSVAVAVAGTVAAMIIEYVTVLRGLTLEPVKEYGVLRYASGDEGSGPPLLVLIVAVALIVAGVIVWRRQKWVWLLLGALVMTIGGSIPIPIPSGAATNAFELLLLVSIVATVARQNRLSS